MVDGILEAIQQMLASIYERLQTTTGRIPEKDLSTFAPVNRTNNQKRTTMETTMQKNRVQLMGNLGRDPEVKEFEGGKRLMRMSVATTETFNFGGGSKEDTQWHNVIAWGKTAELAAQQLRKGSRVSLEGRLVHRTYEKDGQKRYTTEVVMSQFEVMEKQEPVAS